MIVDYLDNVSYATIKVLFIKYEISKRRLSRFEKKDWFYLFSKIISYSLIIFNLKIYDFSQVEII